MKERVQVQQEVIRDYYDSVFEIDAKKKAAGEFVNSIAFPSKWLRILDVHSGHSYREQFFRYLKVQPGKKLLDIGCGFGDLMKIAGKKGLIAYGIDISEKAVEVAKWNTQLDRICCGNAENLPHITSFFDYVTIIGALEHLLSPAKGLQEMLRVCVNRGKLLIVVPNVPIVEGFKNRFRKEKAQLKATNQIYENVLTLKQWKKIFEQNGLTILKIYKDNHTWIKQHYVFKDVFRVLRRAVRKMLPLKFSYQFVFLCTKNNDFLK
ncbi:MAG: class I SAM-dependent methyltransferase [Candidatus Omnitrophota bacterium]